MKLTTQAHAGEFMFLNNMLLPCSEFDFGNISSPSVYEVIRITDSVPLFLEDHLTRLKNSIKLIEQQLEFSNLKLTQLIHQLSAKNNFTTGNIKIVFSFAVNDQAHESISCILFFVPHHYPEAAEYQKGKALQSLIIERPNPNAKISNTNLTQKIEMLKQSTGTDEILLTRHDGIVTEGSKSNIFFIGKHSILTPEQHQVLPGITREKVIAICQQQAIVCKETSIRRDKLVNFSGAFITGTSPKVMPVNAIDGIAFDPLNPIILKIILAYDEMIKKYIEQHSLH